MEKHIGRPFRFTKDEEQYICFHYPLLSRKEIMYVFDLSIPTLQLIFKRNGIKSCYYDIDFDIGEMIELYTAGATPLELANKYNRSDRYITRLLNKLGIETRNCSQARNKQSRYKNKSGYIMVSPVETERYLCDKRIGDIPEHRLVMARYLGRKLQSYEHVHHLNGLRDDNRLENLELWGKHHPYGQRIIDKVNWALQILKTYKKDLKKLKRKA